MTDSAHRFKFSCAATTIQLKHVTLHCSRSQQDLHVEMTPIYQKFRHHTCEAAGVYSILFFSASAGQICSNGAGVWYFHKDSNV